MNRRGRWLATIFASVAAVSLALAGAAESANGPRHRLVKAYSPITMLRAQEEDPPCDADAEQYKPTTVDVVLGNPKVDLVRETAEGRAVGVGDVAGERGAHPQSVRGRSRGLVQRCF